MAKMIIAAVIGVIVVISAFLFIDPNVNKTISGGSNNTTSENISKVSVDIQGAVVTPGVYTLSNTSTLGDLIEKAGGLLDSADYDCFEESICVDGHDLFYIPFIPGYSEECVNVNIVKININTATVEELSSINGISTTIAESIVAYREINGDFQTLEQIMNVSGIGIKTYEKIRDYISIK
ncbi:MAG: ComEA family DNA-binding protein [Bacillales bacterium]|nr:ComEA family DNA-binding protein [Bacillales bacterium]